MQLEFAIKNLNYGDMTLEGVNVKFVGEAEELKDALKNLFNTEEGIKTIRKSMILNAETEKNIKTKSTETERPRANYVTIGLDRDTTSDVKVIDITVNRNTYSVVTRDQDFFIKVISGQVKDLDIIEFVDSIDVVHHVTDEEMYTLKQLDKVMFIDELCSMKAVRAIIK